MAMGLRRRKRSDPTEDLKRLDPRPWSGLDDNAKLHTPEENLIAQRRCSQLIESGYGTVDW